MEMQKITVIGKKQLTPAELMGVISAAKTKILQVRAKLAEQEYLSSADDIGQDRELPRMVGRGRGVPILSRLQKDTHPAECPVLTQPIYTYEEDEKLSYDIISHKSPISKNIDLPDVCKEKGTSQRRIILHRSIDFVHDPPLLQFGKKFSSELESCNYMKCDLCKLVCPPPPYSCETGHLLCFSCASVQRKLLCPLSDKAKIAPETVPCGKLLEPFVYVQFEALFPEPIEKYHCPFRKFGCLQHPLIPREVVEHAQKMCPFRYTTKCFIEGCKGQREIPIPVGNLRYHILESHGGCEINMETYDSKEPLKICYERDPTEPEDIWVPVLFTSKKTGCMYPLVVKRTKYYLYLWLYKIVERDGEVEKLQGKITIYSLSYNESEDLIAVDALHDYEALEEDIIESGRLLTINLCDFEKEYVTFQRDERYTYLPQRKILPVPVYHFYLLSVTISKEVDSNVQKKKKKSKKIRSEAEESERKINSVLNKLAREKEAANERIKNESKKLAKSLADLPLSIQNRPTLTPILKYYVEQG